MDRIITILSCQWRMFWRRFRRRGQVGVGNQAIILIFSVLLLARYLQSLHSAANELHQGKTRVLQSLLLVIFFAWLFPLAGNQYGSPTTRKLLHLPLTLKDLFVIRLVGLFIPPFAWVILAGSLAICYPMIFAAQPIAGITAALLFIAFSGLMGMTLAQLLTRRLWRNLLLALVLLSGIGIFYLFQNDRTRLLSLFSALPASLVTRAALGSQPAIVISELALLTVVALVVAVWSCRVSLEVTDKPRTQRVSLLSWLGTFGSVGGLAAKDFRYFRRLLDPYFGVLIAAVGSLYLISAETVSPGVFQFLLLLVIFPSSSLAFNLFGLDSRGVMDRLHIMPVTGTTILLGKHFGYLLNVGMQMAPLVLLASWRLGLVAAAIGIAQGLSMAALYLAWGNWMSISHPIKLQFFQFSTSNGLIVEGLAGMMIGSLPGMLDIYFMHTGGLAAVWQVVLVLFCSGIVYAISLLRFGSQYSLREEAIRHAVS